RIASRVLGSGETTILVEGGNSAHYLPQGQLVYSQADTLMAVPFDVKNLRIGGAGVPVQSRVSPKSLTGGRLANFSVASNGSLACVPVGGSDFRSLIGSDRGGRRLASLAAQPLEFPRYPRLSPDGGRLAITLGPANEGQIWIYDLKGAGQPVRLTSRGHNLL